MSGIAVTFACGHRESVEATVTAPVCATCGERRVQRSDAPPPRITAAQGCRVTGPLVVTHG